MLIGVPQWLNGLWIQCCHFCGLGQFHGVCLIPGPGTSLCHRYSKKKKKKEKKKKTRWTSLVAYSITSQCCLGKVSASVPGPGSSICCRCGHMFKFKKTQTKKTTFIEV